MNSSLGMRTILAIDISDTRHEQFLLFWIRQFRGISFAVQAERSIPTNSAVREILPLKRLIWAVR